MQRGLFRQAALERLSSPDRLDELMEVTRPRSWLILLGLVSVLVAALLWAVYGSVPTLLRGEGILIREGSVQTVDAAATGELEGLFVRAGDDVQQNQVVARVVELASRQAVTVTSPYTGRVLEVRVTPGDLVSAGTALFSLERPEGALEAVLYLAPAEGARVRPGMEVQVAPASVKREDYGLLLGRVRAVGAFPASQAGMRQVLGSDELARAFAVTGPPIEVRVELARNAATASGYQWTSTLSTVSSLLGALLPAAAVEHSAGRSSAVGPPIVLANGTPCSGEIVTDQQAPINLVLTKVNR